MMPYSPNILKKPTSSAALSCSKIYFFSMSMKKELVSMKNLIALVLLLFIGCTHASTSTRAKDPHLKPQLLIGPIEEIYEVAFNAAKKAFPDATKIRRAEGRKVIIERDWFWRGDTIITVSVNEVEKYECMVTVESKVNWHRLNPCPFDVAMDELRYYGKALEKEYAEYTSPKTVKKEAKSLSKPLNKPSGRPSPGIPLDKSPAKPTERPRDMSRNKPPGKSLSDRLAGIKEALDRGLITQSEYEVKRAKILREY
jgi:hypothetical protein